MKSIDDELRLARPSLRLVSPLSWWTVLIMGLFNLVFGASLFFGVDQYRISASLLIVNDVLTYDFWGIIFFFLGIVKLYSLITNNWKLARSSLFIGVSIKAVWMVALTIRTFISPGTVFLNVLWVTVALLQMGAYIWFLPPSEKVELPGKKEET